MPPYAGDALSPDQQRATLSGGAGAQAPGEVGAAQVAGHALRLRLIVRAAGCFEMIGRAYITSPAKFDWGIAVPLSTDGRHARFARSEASVRRCFVAIRRSHATDGARHVRGIAVPLFNGRRSSSIFARRFIDLHARLWES